MSRLILIVIIKTIEILTGHPLQKIVNKIQRRNNETIKIIHP
jgi:hypothetical protein